MAQPLVRTALKQCLPRFPPVKQRNLIKPAGISPVGLVKNSLPVVKGPQFTTPSRSLSTALWTCLGQNTSALRSIDSQISIPNAFGPAQYPQNRRFASATATPSPSSDSSSSSSDNKKGNNKFAGALVYIFPFVTFFLGTWQVYRLQWKLKLIEDTERKLDDPAKELPADLSPETIDKYQNVRVKLEGHFHHNQEMHMGPRSRGDGDVGFYIVTPFVISENPGGADEGKHQHSEHERKILVNRGFVPRALKPASLRPESLIKGNVLIEGLLRKGEKDSIGLLSKADPAKNMWTWMDAKTMGEFTDSEGYFVVEMVQGPINKKFKIPEPRPAQVNFKNNHLEYAITWYGLSLASAGLLIAGRRRGGSLRSRSRPLR